MTAAPLSPEERANLIVQAFSGQTFSSTAEAHTWLQTQIIGAIRGENEACAMIADDEDGEISYSGEHRNMVARQNACDEIARLIRARAVERLAP